MSKRAGLQGLEDAVRSRIVRTSWLSMLLIYVAIFLFGAGLFTVLYKSTDHRLQRNTNPSDDKYESQSHLTWTDTFYFSVVTQTTLGFGDITPASNSGKLLVALQVFTFGLLLNGFLLGVFVSKVMFHTPRVVFSNVLTHQGGDALQFRFYFDHRISVLNVTIACYLRLTPYPLEQEVRRIIQTRRVEKLGCSTEHEPLIEELAPIFVQVVLPTAAEVNALRDAMFLADPGKAAQSAEVVEQQLMQAVSAKASTAPSKTTLATFEVLKVQDDIAVLISGVRADTGETIIGSKIYSFEKPNELLKVGSFRNIEIEYIEGGRKDSRKIKHDLLDETL